jgi:hypothetical protein
MLGDRPSQAGAVRRWWWRSSQRQRLAATGSATVLGLVVLGVALASVETTPTPSAADPAVPRPVAISGDPVTTTLPPIVPLTTTGSPPPFTVAPTTSTSRRVVVTPKPPPPVEPTFTVPSWFPPPSWPVLTPILPPITGGGVQRGVRVGEPCSPAGAEGITNRGEFVTCQPANLGPKGPADVWRQP